LEQKLEENPNLGEGEDLGEDFNEYIDLLIDKDPLVQHLEQSKEQIAKKIDEMEKYIIRSTKDEWANLEKEMLLNQHKRNRNIIKEIITTCNMFKNEISEEFTNLRGEEEDI